MMEAFLVPERTVVNAKGDGPAVDVSRAEGRIFLLTLALTNIIEQECLAGSLFRTSEGRIFLLTIAITNIIEQESLDVSIFGSADGATWDAKPVMAFPQKFYCEEVPLLLNLTARPEIKC